MLATINVWRQGHYLPNQALTREQFHNSKTMNLLDDFVLHCRSLFARPLQHSLQQVNSVVILEVIQGPCNENQKYFAVETDLLETLNHYNLHETPEVADMWSWPWWWWKPFCDRSKIKANHILTLVWRAMSSTVTWCSSSGKFQYVYG